MQPNVRPAQQNSFQKHQAMQAGSQTGPFTVQKGGGVSANHPHNVSLSNSAGYAPQLQSPYNFALPSASATLASSFPLSNWAQPSFGYVQPSVVASANPTPLNYLPTQPNILQSYQWPLNQTSIQNLDAGSAAYTSQPGLTSHPPLPVENVLTAQATQSVYMRPPAASNETKSASSGQREANKKSVSTVEGATSTKTNLAQPEKPESSSETAPSQMPSVLRPLAKPKKVEGSAAKPSQLPLSAASPLPENLFPGESAEDLAANDPLATQMWKFFSKAKGTMPHAARMENLSWRMGGMKISQVVAAQEPSKFGSSVRFAERRRKSRSRDRRASRSPSAEVAAQQSSLYEDELERRGRQSKSNSGTPDYSGSSGNDMDWKAQSRSRSRPPASDMDWRNVSRSRSRARPRLSLPQSLGYVEEAPSSALPEARLPFEEELYALFAGAPLPPLPLPSLSPKGKEKALEPEVSAKTTSVETFSHDWLANLEREAANTSPVTINQPRSFNMDPMKSHKNNASIPGLWEERLAPENQSLDFGFLPKLVRKTSADAAFSSSLASASKKAVASVDDAALGLTNANNPVGQIAAGSIDLAALSRPAPSNVSSLLSSSAPKEAAIFTQPFSAISPAASTSAPLSQLYNPLAFQSLPNSPLLSQASQYFNFPQFTTPTTPSFVDPAVLSGMQPFFSGSSTTLLPLQSYSPEQDLQWAMSPDSLTNLHSRPPTPGEISRNSSYVDISTLNAVDISASQSFEGGPKRTMSTKQRRQDGHARSQSIPNGFTAANQTSAAGAGDTSALVCSNCKTSNTPLWRRDDAGNPLCNGCGLFKKLHGVDRPLSLATGIIKKRNRSKLKPSEKSKSFSATSRATTRKSSVSSGSH